MSKRPSRQGGDGCRSALGLLPPARWYFDKKPGRVKENGAEETCGSEKEEISEEAEARTQAARRCKG